ncbi:hypothetical protein FRX31_012526 [Thalictrum thalictroides]|uniref:Uncharacterized protein n=1 Tax=Thalictrum thalictroides TaxID=46969 RepID=A0A7J6WLN4_THATH|nr:hypothetical protein FRX31_012526 [Thalictrum thalictroides]
MPQHKKLGPELQHHSSVKKKVGCGFLNRVTKSTQSFIPLCTSVTLVKVSPSNSVQKKNLMLVGKSVSHTKSRKHNSSTIRQVILIH